MSFDEQIFDYFPILFLGIWCTVSLGIAALGGWWQLSHDYRATSDFLGRRWRFQSLSLRFGTSYNNVVTIGADPAGLYLACFLLFRLGHPPLYIPWSDLLLSREKFFFSHVVTLTTVKHPSIHIRLRTRVFARIEAVLGDSIPLQLAAREAADAGGRTSQRS